MEIKDFKHACQVLKISKELPTINGCSERDKRAFLLWYQLTKIVEAINPKGYIPNWSDEDEYKYVPYYKWHVVRGENVEDATVYHEGFAFVAAYYYSHFFFIYSTAAVGGWFCFKTNTDAEYFGREFEKEMSEYLLLKNFPKNEKVL